MGYFWDCLALQLISRIKQSTKTYTLNLCTMMYCFQWYTCDHVKGFDEIFRTHHTTYLLYHIMLHMIFLLWTRLFIVYFKSEELNPHCIARFLNYLLLIRHYLDRKQGIVGWWCCFKLFEKSLNIQNLKKKLIFNCISRIFTKKKYTVV